MTLFDPHSIVVVTNALVMCFEIETTQLVPAACPDGIEGCCVAHYQEVKKKRYVPCLHEVQTNEFGGTKSGIGFKLDLMQDIATAIRLYHCPSVFSIQAADVDGRPTFDVVGWIWRDKLLEAVKKEEERIKLLEAQEAQRGGAR